jgi:rubredoxin
MSKLILSALFAVLYCSATTEAFSSPAALRVTGTGAVTHTRSAFGLLQRNHAVRTPLFMSSEQPDESQSSTAVTEESDPMDDAMEEVDEGTRTMMEKQKRADELRSQEVFMKKSTGKHRCTNCDWEFDILKGDSMMIGGQIKPGTEFNELPSNWRCPVCRASKDSFNEVVIEIPGFEVNQGYGLGANAWSSDTKNGVIFGGLAIFFALFIGGYGMS